MWRRRELREADGDPTLTSTRTLVWGPAWWSAVRPERYDPSDNGDRIRSISMNAAMVGHIPPSGTFTLMETMMFVPNWRLYLKMSDLTCPSPANAWIFCDEAMRSLNDGYLQMNLQSPDYPDIPANYDCGGNNFTFADGHGEYRKWMWTGSPTTGLRSVPYKKDNIGGHWGSSGQDVDWLWLGTYVLQTIIPA